MDDYKYIRLAYKEAIKAYQKNEVPVGCVIVRDDIVLSKAHNMREAKKSAVSHAEIEAISKACKKTKEKFLEGATIYITLEPCLMCMGAIIQARIGRIVYSANEPKFGSIVSIGNILNDYKLNHRIDVSQGLMEEEVESLMKKFFKELRESK
ncbi:MAG: nucleoside deaminase [Bacilli bacterium]|nr:nucleoside deaminase [Bacilli bacterium]